MPHLARMLVGVALVVAASPAVAEWVVVVPPSTRKRDCTVVYDRSASISTWREIWFPFDTADACEALRTEMVRRTTAPGRRERILALSKQRQAEAFEAQRDLRRSLKDDPDAKRLLRLVPRYRKDDPALCEVEADEWTESRCVEREAH